MAVLLEVSGLARATYYYHAKRLTKPDKYADVKELIFEIYTESYGVNPIVIMGAGAGAKVTARGVFGDILRLSETK